MTTDKARTRTEGDYGNTPQATALRLQLAGVAALERTPLYQEMCAAANRTVAAGGGYSAHGWGEYGANGDPRKRRKAAS